MSKSDAGPPSAYATGVDDGLRPQGTPPVTPAVDIDGNELVDMDAYRQSVPLWKRIHQNSLTQMILMSVQAFCGPAMADAIAGE